jgi:CRP-like cAMP-binding protein
VFFIVAGRVKFYYNIFYLEPTKTPYLKPFNMHVSGSYFGDNDVFTNKSEPNRDSTSVAVCDCQLLVINIDQLNDVLKVFPAVKKDMKLLAHKRTYHNTKMIEEIKLQH